MDQIILHRYTIEAFLYRFGLLNKVLINKRIISYSCKNEVSLKTKNICVFKWQAICIFGLLQVHSTFYINGINK